MQIESFLTPSRSAAVDRLRVLCVDAQRPVAVIPAAGLGERSGLAIPKQYHRIAGHTMLAQSVRAMASFAPLAAVVVVLHPDDQYWVTERVDDELRGLDHVVAVRVGGKTRRESVMAGCELIREAVGSTSAPHGNPNRWVMVHDAARPGVSRASLARLWDVVRGLDRLNAPAAGHAMGAILAVPVADTIKSAQSFSASAFTVDRTVDRSRLWAAQTPQAFTLTELLAAYVHHAQATDEASAIEAEGGAVLLVAGEGANFKVTQPQDIELMEAIMSSSATQRSGVEMPMAVGQGFDVHALVEGRPLIIGGVEIPHPKGLLGHSDADVLLHAITDAILGAACMGDIGRHFPDTDPAYRGADSAKLLKEAVSRVAQAGWAVAGIDATVIAQAPKIAPYAARMQQVIGDCCGLDPARVNVKGKTTEGLGWTGRGEGIAAQAVATLLRNTR